MPKLQLPSEERVQASLDSMWHEVGPEYRDSHIESNLATFRAHRATEAVRRQAKRRAKDAVNYCRKRLNDAYEGKMSVTCRSVDLIDHTPQMPECAPNFVIECRPLDQLHLKICVQIHKPTSKADLDEKLAGAIAMLGALTDN